MDPCMDAGETRAGTDPVEVEVEVEVEAMVNAVDSKSAPVEPDASVALMARLSELMISDPGNRIWREILDRLVVQADTIEILQADVANLERDNIRLTWENEKLDPTPPQVDADDFRSLLRGCSIHAECEPFVEVIRNDYVNIYAVEVKGRERPISLNVQLSGAKAYLQYKNWLGRHSMLITDRRDSKENIEKLGQYGFDAAIRIANTMMAYLRSRLEVDD